MITIICDALRELVPYLKFKKRENTHERVLLLVKLQTSNTPPWVFFILIKLYKWYKIAQSIIYQFAMSTRQPKKIIFVLPFSQVLWKVGNVSMRLRQALNY